MSDAYAHEFDWTIRRALLARWRPHFKVGGQTLEVGCYKGDMTRLILEELGSATVVEANQEWAQNARELFPGRVDVAHSSIEEWATPRRFDQIFLVHTLEHIAAPAQALAKLGSLLAPGGRLFVGVPNAFALSRQIAVGMGLVPSCEAVTDAEREHGHHRTYGAAALRAEAEAAGLRVVEEGGVIVKPLSNSQFDQALAAGIVSAAYVDACEALSLRYPELSASIHCVCAAEGP